MSVGEMEKMYLQLRLQKKAKHNAALVKQGTTRKQILQSAQGVLNIEETINNANKLALLTGKQMNISELMSAALAVDTAEGIDNKKEAEENYAKLLRKEVDSMGGLNGMSEIKKRTLLETLKISEEELIAKYNANIAQKNNNKLIEEGNALVGSMFAGTQSVGAGLFSAGVELAKMIAQAMIFNKVMSGSFGMGNFKFGKFGGGGGDGDDVNPLDKSKTKRANVKGKGGSTIGKTIGSLGSGVGTAMKGIAKGFDAFATPQVILGVAVITGAMIGLGFALKLAAPGIEAIGKAIATVIGGIGDFIVKIAQIANPELAGGLALFGLAMIPFSLGLIELAAGLAILSPVLPELLALVALGAGIALIANALNGGGSSETTTSNTTQSDPLLEEIRGLRADIKAQPINVVLNGKIVGEINKGSRAINSYVNK